MSMSRDLFPSGFQVFTAAGNVDWCGMYAAAAGSVVVVDGNGVTSTIPMAAGSQIMGAVKAVTSTTITAGNLIGLTRG